MEEVIGAIIGTLTAFDVDAGDSLIYSVPSNSGYRIINGNELALAANRKLDLEDPSVRGSYASRNVTVTVTDSGGLTATLVVTVVPTNVNEAPHDCVISGTSCLEESAGAVIGTLSATDPDASDSLVFSVPADSGYRIIHGNQLALTGSQKLDLEDASVRGSYAARTVQVTATDGGGLTATLSVTVTPTNVNEAPSNVAIDSQSCAEEIDGATIGTLSAQDVDANDTRTFSVPPDSGYRIVSGNQLALAADRRLDFENPTVRGSYASRSVVVTVADGGGLTANRTVTITPTDVNEAPSQISISNATCAEESDGVDLGTLNANEVDAGDTVTFSVSAGSGYRIVGGKLALAADRRLDFENPAARGSYAPRTVVVTATDRGGLTASLSVTAVPTNVNEAPAGPTIDAGSCPEEADGAVVGNLAAADVDAGDARTFSVPADSGYRIVNGNELALAADRRLDFEDASVRGRYAARTVQVTVTDAGGLSASSSIIVTPTGVNEAPFDLVIDGTSCPEESDGVVVGTLAAQDVDAGDVLEFSVEAGFGYRIFAGNQLALAADRRLDAEDATVRGVYASRSVVVTATDADGLTTAKLLTVTPIDANEAPSGIAISDPACPEETDGASIGVLSVQESDAGDEVVFSVPAGSGYRIIGGSTLALAADRRLDLEDASVRGSYASRTVLVQATDGGGLSTSVTLTVSPDNVNEAPYGAGIDDSACSEESDGAIIGTLNAEDVDAGDTLAYSVPAGSGYRIVNGSQLALAADRRLDFENSATRDPYAPRTVIVTVTDGGGLSVSLPVTVTPININEAPSAPIIGNSTCAEETLGVIIGTLSSADADAGDTVAFSVVADSGYRIIGGTTLALAADRKLDLEDPSVRGAYASRLVTVTATDAGGLTASRSFAILPTNLNEAPTGIGISSSACAEETDGVVIGTLAVQDSDAGDTVVYSVPSGSGYRIVGGNQLALAADRRLDLEDESVRGPYAPRSVSVRATDAGGLAIAVSFTISPVNVNEVPYSMGIDNASCAEEAEGSIIGILTALDVDVGDVPSYAVPVGSGYRIVDGDRLALAPDRRLDFEDPAARDPYAARTVVVTVIDGGGLSATLAVTVSPTDVNEAPSTITISTSMCAEETVGAAVGVLGALDVDAGDTVAFSVAADSGYRIVGGSTLSLAADRKLDLEDASVRGSYAPRTVVVTATDGGGLTTTRSFTIMPSNVNEAPVDVAISGTACAEEADGAVIGSLMVSDIDVGDPITWSVPTGSGYRIVGGNQLALAVDRRLDLEEPSARGIYAPRSVTVTATDAGGLSASARIRVTPTNVNEAPFGLGIAATSCAEETEGPIIGELNASDVDADDTRTFSVAGDSGYRIVDGNRLALAADRRLDFEDPATRGSYAPRTVIVTVTDGGGLSTALPITVVATNVNEAPFDLRLANSACPEEADGAIVGALAVGDVDADDVLTYSVPPDSGYRIVDGQLALAVGFRLDREDPSARGVYAPRQVLVTATDAGGLSTSLHATVSANDVNEPPNGLRKVATAFIEDVELAAPVAGRAILALEGQDGDPTEAFHALTYSLAPSAGTAVLERFEVVGAELRRRDGIAFDAEAQAAWTVPVLVSDGGTPALSTTVEVMVTVDDDDDPLRIAGWASGAVAVADIEQAVPVAAGLAWFDQDAEAPLVDGGSPPFARYDEFRFRFRLTGMMGDASAATADQAKHQLQFELPANSTFSMSVSGDEVIVSRVGQDGAPEQVASVSFEDGNRAALQVLIAGDRATGNPAITRGDLDELLQGIAYHCFLASGKGVPDLFLACSVEHPWEGHRREWIDWRRITVSTANRRPLLTAVGPHAVLEVQRGNRGMLTDSRFRIDDDYPELGARLVVVYPPLHGRLEREDEQELEIDGQGRGNLLIAPAMAGTKTLPYRIYYRPDINSTASSDSFIVQIVDGGVDADGAGSRTSELVPIPVVITPGTAPGISAVMDERSIGASVTFTEQGEATPVVPAEAFVRVTGSENGEHPGTKLGNWTLYAGPQVSGDLFLGTEADAHYQVIDSATVRQRADAVEFRPDQSAGSWTRIGTISSVWNGIGRSLEIELNPETTQAQASQLVRAIGFRRTGRRIPLARFVVPVGIGFVASDAPPAPNAEQISRQTASIGVVGIDDPPAWTSQSLVLRTTNRDELIGVSEVVDPDGGPLEFTHWEVSPSRVALVKSETELDLDDVRLYRFTWSVRPDQAAGAAISFADGTTQVRQQITVQEVGSVDGGLAFVSDAPFFQAIGERRFLPLLLTDGENQVTSGVDLFLTFPPGTTDAQRDLIVSRIRPNPSSGQLLLDFTGDVPPLTPGEVLRCTLVANRTDGGGVVTAQQPIMLKVLPSMTVRGVAQ